MAYPTIRAGSKGTAVQQAQQALTARGYSVGAENGIFGPYTHIAVLNYQYDRSADRFWAKTYPLAVDAIIGPKTWGRLLPATVQKGSSGTGVRLLQAILKNLRYSPWDPGPVDGIFGPKTEHAVHNIQGDLGLPVDGIVGPQTWRSLWS
jgi:peptidoglycan hydrolase-like protein with peptidoglycan-binding domain